ncbi:MAG: TetR/AcrR family transcriptional regulator [Candidatus Limivicinus sp.]|nr:TetR/AcrR family transcriptional regulator [Candidatus Limivicinus sp.]
MDRRVIRTKKAIRNAFAQLLSVKKLEDITVKDIAELADINRKTFYSYYSGVYMIVEETENELVETFEAAIRDLPLDRLVKEPYLLFSRLSAIINADMDFYEPLMKADQSSNLLTKVSGMLKQKVRESYAAFSHVDEATFNVMVDFTFSGLFSVYQSWFNSERRQSIEEISRTLGILCFEGINGLKKE